MNSLSQLSFVLGSWASTLPASVRKRVYQSVKVLASLATLALLVLPLLPGLGINLPTAEVAPVTAILAFVAHLADRNTVVEPQVDVTPAPETGNPTHPAA